MVSIRGTTGDLVRVLFSRNRAVQAALFLLGDRQKVLDGSGKRKKLRSISSKTFTDVIWGRIMGFFRARL